MKNYILTFIIFCTISFSYAQRQNGKNLEFNYIQSPLVKIDRSWGYKAKVIQHNKLMLHEKREAYRRKVENANMEYQEAMETYRNYSTAERVLTREPVRKIVPSYFIGREYDEKILAAQYIEIMGFEKKPEDPEFIIKIILEGFHFIAAEKKITKNSELHYYSLSYKNPISIKIYDSNRTNLLNEQIDASVKTFDTDKNPSSYEMEKSWRASKVNIITSLEESSTREQLEAANRSLNSYIGYPEKTKDIKLYTAKGKKLDYSNMDIALSITQRTLINFKDDTENSKIELLEAVAIWESELLQKDIGNKKARINKVVGAAIYINCSYVYTIIGNYEQANKSLKELKILKPGRFIPIISEVESFINEYQERNPKL